MADLLQPANGAERMANALLNSNGGGVVFLRVPVQAIPGSDAEQLGLATPQFQDVPLAPAVWRRCASSSQLLLSATALRGVVDTLSATSAQALFTTAAGVLVDGLLYEIVDFEASEAKGEPFCYRITVRKPQR
jgi:hypothetical protein